ncbi:helix-turn-helix domain-containing protein [Mammaliicoccus sciuri]|uniref:helix-turn-helix domain-containing protein n=1 Tax=Mammaliicoccus sciuri TaxID=1296 RepID=UPI003F5537C0
MTTNTMPLESRIKIVKDIVDGNISRYSAAKNHEVSSATLQERVRIYNAYSKEGLNPFGKRTKYSSELKSIAIENVLERNII